MKNLLRALMIVALGVWLAGCKAGRDAYAVTSTDTLIKFKTDNTSKIDSEVPITGLASGETLQQIDFRPSNGLLYGVTSQARVVTVDTGSGVATPVGTVPFTSDSLANIAMDVNPQGDYLRVIALDTTATTSNGVRTYFNARLDPSTGAITTNDSTTLSFKTNDTNAGETPSIVAIAHTNDRTNATSTTLYGLEFNSQSLVSIATSGVLTTIGPVGTSFSESAGFDIVRKRGDNDGDTGVPYVSLSQASGNAKFYDIDLAKGTASSSSDIGSNRQIRSIAVVLDPPKSSGFNY